MQLWLPHEGRLAPRSGDHRSLELWMGAGRGCSPGAWEPVRSSLGSVSRYAALSLVTFSQPSSGSAVCCQVTKSGSSQRPWGAAPTTSGSARGGARLSQAGPRLRLSQGASKVSAGTKSPRVSPGAGATAQSRASEDRALGGLHEASTQAVGSRPLGPGRARRRPELGNPGA